MTVCNRCGKENQDHYKFCLGCGAELTAAPKPGGDVAMMKTMMADPHHRAASVRRRECPNAARQCPWDPMSGPWARALGPDARPADEVPPGPGWPGPGPMGRGTGAAWATWPPMAPPMQPPPMGLPPGVPVLACFAPPASGGGCGLPRVAKMFRRRSASAARGFRMDEAGPTDAGSAAGRRPAPMGGGAPQPHRASSSCR
jgi:hypothetical protein